ncbi:kinase domain protein (macronuclear) [Tetrahymena thermophila SB210]|uniref:Kinase domain protein n=1 Tax=Tetrahymena thermophila (strain SB210) TaxID=312017 RepID=Q22ND9_TETTS|nr:kinase domain protein [Tetrahymena thermophila SB210]EAR86846.2 kinase domain protein [Tetrahymena thermophila SB210]|eukprot:XP_001007091.2 kinase domain protein [Tetrahymena thermophila SB210]
MIFIKGQYESLEKFSDQRLSDESILDLRSFKKPSDPIIESNIIETFSNLPNLKTLIIEQGFNSCASDIEFLTILVSNLKKCTKLSTLSIIVRGISMSEHIEALSQGLINLPNLSNLNLDLSYCKIEEKKISILGQQLAQCHNLSILAIDLEHNFNDVSLNGSNFAYNLALLISKFPKLSELTLSLNSNQLDGKCQSNICTALENCSNLKKLALNLSSNHIEGMWLLGQNYNQSQPSKSFILPSFKSVSTLFLDFRYNNLDGQHASQFGAALSQCQNLQNLELIIAGNEIGAEGTANLAQGLAKCQNLQKLKLQINNNKIGDDGISELANALIKLPELSDLSLLLKSNNIKDKGIANFSSKLPQFANLKYLELDLWYNRISSLGAQSLGEKLKQCINFSTLILNLQYNKISYEGALCVSKSLTNLTNLQYLKLDLRFSKIGYSGPSEVISTLANCKNLRILILGFGENNIDDQEELLKSKIMRIKQLIQFELNLYDDFGEVSNDSGEEMDD